MNSLPVILTYFIQGGGKCLFFAITSLLIQLRIAQFQNGKKKLYTRVREIAYGFGCPSEKNVSPH